MFSLSTDNGATWTDPEPLNTNAASDSASDIIPQLTTDKAGKFSAGFQGHIMDFQACTEPDDESTVRADDSAQSSSRSASTTKGKRS